MVDVTATKAQELHDQLVGTGFPNLTTDLTGNEYSLPENNPLDITIDKVTLDELTDGAPDGAGAFDRIMTSVKAHIQEEFEENRITGEEYSKTYIELTTAALSTGLQYLLQRDSLFMQNQLVKQQTLAAQAQAITAGVALEETKLQVKLAEIQGINAKAEHALLKMKLATEDINYDLVEKRIAEIDKGISLSDYQLTDMLPEQKRQLVYQTDHIMTSQKDINIAQKDGTEAVTAKTTYETASLLPQELALGIAKENLTLKEIGIAGYRLTDIMPAEKDNLLKDALAKIAGTAKIDYETQQIMPQQKINLERDGAIKSYQLSNTLVQQYDLLKEQTEVQRGQTQDTRLDGTTPVTGAIGKQKDLYSQQIDSYKKDARYKVGKMWLDQWITQKSLDEGLFAPDQFSNTNFNEVLLSMRQDNNLGS